MAIKDTLQPGAIILMEALTASGNQGFRRWPGGTGSFQVFGTFGGSDSVKLQLSLDQGTTFTDITGASWTAAAVGDFTAGMSVVRAVATIADTSSINVILSPSDTGNN